VISQLSAGRKNRLWLEVDGMEASAAFDQEHPEQLWIGTEYGSQLLVRDPNQGSPEQRRLAMLPAGHAEGYAQCFERYVADSYAAVDAYNGEASAPRACRPSPTGCGRRRSATRCCGRRPARNGCRSAELADAP
jgi:hypothetical protein